MDWMTIAAAAITAGFLGVQETTRITDRQQSRQHNLFIAQRIK